MSERPPLRLIEGGGRPQSQPEPERPGLAAAFEFIALGVGLTLTIVLMARLPFWFRDLGTFQALFAFAFAFYGLALLRLKRYASLPHVGIAVFAVALATRAALLPAPPSLSGDIYRYVWEDRARGGALCTLLRCARKKRRKRYARYDSRGRLAGKRHISERPVSVEHRQAVGHWEIDTVMGVGNDHCIVTLVERATGYVLIGKLRSRNMGELARRTIQLVRRQPGKFRTITADNGTEFHSYKAIERATGVKFYFATPHHAWERATNENTNGLIRQYLPKRTSMAHVTQHDCNAIAKKLNTRPRKRYDFDTPEERFHAA